MMIRVREGGDLESGELMKGHRVLDRRNQLAKLWHCRVTTVQNNILHVSKS